MNRRRFFKSSGLALAAIAGLPRGLKSQYYSDPRVYKTEFDKNLADQWIYEVRIDHDALKKFSSATEAEKIITIKIAEVLKGDYNNRPVEGEHQFLITSAVKGKTLYDTWDIETKFIKTISGKNKFEKGFPKNPLLRCNEMYFVNIIGKDNKTFKNLTYHAGDNDEGDCFLTCACVQHKKMEDNCEDLQLLRGLRDQFMATTIEGRALLTEYKNIGPAMVKKIHQYDNKEEILEYLYDQLVIPSVNMIKANQKEEAVRYYAHFVNEMKTQYLQ